MRLNPYLTFNGECEAAFRFYEACLGGTIEALASFGETPACGELPPEWHGKIMHARLAIGEQVLMGSDSPPGQQRTMGGFSVALAVDDPQAAERLFHALASGGTVQMPIQATFWAERFGMLTDRFGVSWMVNCEGSLPQPSATTA
jgi:PhnB protein